MLQRGWLLSQMMGEWEPSWHAAGEQPWASGTQGLLVHSSVTDLSLGAAHKARHYIRNHRQSQHLHAGRTHLVCLPSVALPQPSQARSLAPHPTPAPAVCVAVNHAVISCVSPSLCEMEVKAKSFTLQCNQEPVLAGFFRKQSHKQGPTCV